MRVMNEAKPAAFAVAPTVAAVLALAAGAMLLASGATPSEPERFVRLLAYLPPIVIELSHFVSSILGLLLVLLAFGLRSRLGAAWTATQVTLAAAALLALAKGFNWEESAVLLAILIAVAPFGAAFPRTARLNRMEITPGWMVSAAALLLGAALLGWWSFDNADYGTESWWRLMADADAERAIRSSAGAAVALFAVGV